jgi:hypothetical protein|tara:strand:- start:1052 stop:1324 length:273 start_codon:yes stop_codon:yes gene_type:complete
MNNYRYNNDLSSVNFRYIAQIKKDNNIINKSIKIPYLKLIELLELKKDDLNIDYKCGTTRQFQLLQMLLLKEKDLNIIKCNVYVGDEIIL